MPVGPLAERALAGFRRKGADRGRWQSPSMPGRYARGPLARRGAVARLRYGV